MLKSKSLPILAGAALGALALMGPVAHADQIMGTLDVANANLFTQGSGPYASFTIAGVSGGNGSTTFTRFHVSATGLNSFVFGDGNIFDLNLLDTPMLVSGSCDFSPCSQDTSNGSVDGFGKMNLKIDDGAGFSSTGLPTLSFDFTTSVAEITQNLLVPLSDDVGASAAAHMALSSNTACTGFAGNAGTNGMGTNSDTGNCVAVPAPLVGHGILALLAIGGVLFGGKFLESLKKHRMQAA